ncbi:MAG: hypothetical protein J7J93_02890 [Candidatus Aenigmarchaeota archaeon]|nr:hypothetical protein [Candidatus Aenigmarchaeota archaeon]
MKLADKFELNTKDFKIYFDNVKKTHICENLETGEKTNLGCLGILMQMGILRPINNSYNNNQNLTSLVKRLDDLEEKVNNIIQKLQQEKEGKTIKIKKKSDDELKEHIMEKVLEKTREPEDENINQESEEEIDNWMEI